MCCKDKKEFYPIIMGLCPKPRDLTLCGQKHDKTKAVQKVLPMSSSPTSALGLLPSRALSSELVQIE
jgi:hypothetical protein